MDQKANSVADLAAVLFQQSQKPTAEQIKLSNARIEHNNRKRKRKGNKNVWGRPVPAEELSGVKGVKVRWADKLDAGFARRWPEHVSHGDLLKNRHTAAFPPAFHPKRGQISVPDEVAPDEEAT